MGLGPPELGVGDPVSRKLWVFMLKADECSGGRLGLCVWVRAVGLKTVS